MAEASILVNLSNPGQVFACLGFLEASDYLLGNVQGRFDWSNERQTRFFLRVLSQKNPFAAVLEFLASAEISAVVARTNFLDEGIEDAEDTDSSPPELSETFPSPRADRMGLPIRLKVGNQIIDLGHWADGARDDSFKLYSGNRSALSIARAMIMGTRSKPQKKQPTGQLKTKGIAQLWDEHRDRLVVDPLNVLVPMRGSFNFDPRGSWTAIDVGYSPNEHDHAVEASPVVEMLAAWGLENMRPSRSRDRSSKQVCYAVWNDFLPPILARPALSGSLALVGMKYFSFTLGQSGKNKVITFAEQETSR